MTKTEAENLVMRAWKLAESLDHGYCTIEHLIAVAYRDNNELWADVTKFIIDNAPELQSGETLGPTLGFQRITKRMLIDGSDLVSAITAEGADAWGPIFLARHGVTEAKRLKAKI
ncbi:MULTISPECIES: hypothetical protein [unclassified Undibacterium]|uniref:hypothetical protein n=1 Tax=unclassified Undibacterium TaxID=2630295 RepID=UPI002AC9DB1C|nr:MULTISPECIES: hypothetical protein [unclassified Undibacterium]MEB0140351.1 hypothetical protein [Undibacterium sp. CCC2.1]MEB0173404.1 hypothetical protein [Undibacterium sp. CCC1.1]MEB0176801.1 hypothetical protein [Undibacterium sp. CCC3.4]MEB0216542.1 hypothetical protein [Undibacterium sp. 5I2]WPX43379.1 hypothetical protein RHM61_18680 [Undibacterium sp. CCC3.4]